MKKVLKKVDLPSDIIDSIEYSFFMKEADVEILDHILTKKSGYDYNEEMFNYFYKKYQKNRTTFEIKAREVATEFAGDVYTIDKDVEINFLEGVMYIYEEEENRRIPKSNCKNSKN